jgi:hypothetical protein
VDDIVLEVDMTEVKESRFFCSAYALTYNLATENLNRYFIDNCVYSELNCKERPLLTLKTFSLSTVLYQILHVLSCWLNGRGQAQEL